MIDGLPLLEIAPDAVRLAERFIAEKAIPSQAAEDALHIAIAAVNGINYLLTWNLKHIANAVIRAHVEAICRMSGYEPPVICTPSELMDI